MLQDMRHTSNSWLIYLLFGIIILVFVFMFGLPRSDNMGARDPVVASVKGHEIKASDVKSATIRIYGDNLRNDQFLAAQHEILLKMAMIYLLSDKAEEMGMRVSEDELHDYLTNWQSHNADVFAFLNSKNEFSQRAFEQYATRAGATVKSYMNFKKRELLARNYLAVLENSVYVSDVELQRRFKEARTSVELNYVELKPSVFEKLIVPVTDEDVAAFVVSGNDEIEKYYKDNNSQFVTPEKVQLQEIVIQKRYDMLKEVGAKTDKGLSAFERFNIAKVQVFDKGVSLEQAFTDYDESILKRPNGIGNMLDVNYLQAEYKTALDGKKIGDVFSIETPDTYVIAKLMQHTDRIETPVADVKNDIARTILTQKRLNEARDKAAQAMLAEIQSGKTLEEALESSVYAGVLAEAVVAEPVAAEENPEGMVAENDNPPAAPEDNAAVPAVPEDNVEAAVAAAPTAPIIPLGERILVETTGPYLMNTTYIQRLGDQPDIARAVIATEEGKNINEMFTVDDARIFVAVKSKSEPTEESFKEEVEKIRAELTYDKVATFIGPKMPNDPFTFAILRLQGEPGAWLQAMLDAALLKGDIRENKDYFGDARGVSLDEIEE